MAALPSTPFPSNPVPAGFDWADGKEHGDKFPAVGTPTPKGKLLEIGSEKGGRKLEESPNSPEIERAEQGTITHSFATSWDNAVTLISIYGRGALIQDSYGYYYRVLSSKIARTRGNQATLTVVAESISFDTPPDEFSIVPVEMGVDILKHPRYFYALTPTSQIQGFSGTPDTPTEETVKQAIIRSLQTYRDAPFAPTKQNIDAFIGFSQDLVVRGLASGKMTYRVPNPDFNPSLPAVPDLAVGATPDAGQNVQFLVKSVDNSGDTTGKIAMARAAALEIIQKLWRMEDTPYTTGWQITWSEYWFRPPPLNPGGYVEDPRGATPALPNYFYSTAFPANVTQTIFDKMGYYNPQCYSESGLRGGTVNMSWLRKADEIDFQRTWFKVTRTWIGAPLGAWDSDLYNQKPRPQTPQDYRKYPYTSS